jgi:hypothetical protein
MHVCNGTHGRNEPEEHQHVKGNEYPLDYFANKSAPTFLCANYCSHFAILNALNTGCSGFAGICHSPGAAPLEDTIKGGFLHNK